jgi:hypothetical protein
MTVGIVKGRGKGCDLANNSEGGRAIIDDQVHLAEYSSPFLA